MFSSFSSINNNNWITFVDEFIINAFANVAKSTNCEIFCVNDKINARCVFSKIETINTRWCNTFIQTIKNRKRNIASLKSKLNTRRFCVVKNANYFKNFAHDSKKTISMIFESKCAIVIVNISNWFFSRSRFCSRSIYAFSMTRENEWIKQWTWLFSKTFWFKTFTNDSTKKFVKKTWNSIVWHKNFIESSLSSTSIIRNDDAIDVFCDYIFIIDHINHHRFDIRFKFIEIEFANKLRRFLH